MLADYSSLKLRHRRYVALCTIYILAVPPFLSSGFETGLGGADDDDHLELKSIDPLGLIKEGHGVLFAFWLAESSV
jgi:hypothetical protein